MKMHNILGIMKHDLKKVTGSVVAIVILLGLCIVPCLYAWFNIFSNWAPYESDATGRIKVAVANLDKGASAAGLDVNVGDKIISALEGNDAIGWSFVDSAETAKEGVYSGDYYAALVIPEEFTADVLSFTKGSLENPKIKYYENEKKNAIAPKITSKAKTALQEEVNATFVETLASYISKASQVADENDLSPSAMLTDLSDNIDDLSRDIDSCIVLASSAASLTSAADNLLGVSDSMIYSTKDFLSANDKVLKQLDKDFNKISKKQTKAHSDALDDVTTILASINALKELTTNVLSLKIPFDIFVDSNRDLWKSKVDEMISDCDSQADALYQAEFTGLAAEFRDLSSYLGEVSNDLAALDKSLSAEGRVMAMQELSDDIDKAAEQAEDICAQMEEDLNNNLETALSNTSSAIASFRTSLSSANSGLSKLSKSMNGYSDSLSGLKYSVELTESSLRNLQDGADSVSGLMMDASGNELIQAFNDMTGDDEADVAEYLANPVQMKTEVIWPIENYGSAMAPFYTVLAQWVGALLTCVLIKVRLRNRSSYDKLRLHQWYFGRYGLFLLVGIAQALIVSLGDLLYIGIQCGSPEKFVLAACVNGIVFMMINYALSFALDNIGLALGVIILVLQVGGSGGTYPPEVLPEVFRVIQPYMPFLYSMNAMRECIAGMYENTYWQCLGILLLFFVFFTAFGLAFYRPARKLNEMIAISKAKSEIML